MLRFVIVFSVITELIIGYALPGRPVAMMMFKTWGYISVSQALTFTSDFKLGHYMKINPRQMFWSQIVAAVIGGTVQLGVQAWMFTNIPDMCSPSQPNSFIVSHARHVAMIQIQHFTGSAHKQRSSVPPQSSGVSSDHHASSLRDRYTSMSEDRSALLAFTLISASGSGLVWFFLVGALCPLVAWTVSLRWPNSFVKYVNFPVIFSGTGSIPPATAINYVPWAIVGFIFNYVVRRRHFSWWTKYNCKPSCVP